MAKIDRMVALVERYRAARSAVREIEERHSELHESLPKASIVRHALEQRQRIDRAAHRAAGLHRLEAAIERRWQTIDQLEEAIFSAVAHTPAGLQAQAGLLLEQMKEEREIDFTQWMAVVVAGIKHQAAGDPPAPRSRASKRPSPSPRASLRHAGAEARA